MASLIHSRKKILSNFQLKECQTKFKKPDSDTIVSFFPLTSVQIDGKGIISDRNVKQKDLYGKRDLSNANEKQIFDKKNSFSERRSYFDETNQSTAQQSDLILKKSISQLNISKIQRTQEDSFLSPAQLNEQFSYPSPIQDGSSRKNVMKDRVIESISIEDQYEDIQNLSAIHSPIKEQSELQTNKKVLPKILNYQDLLQLKQFARKDNSSFYGQDTHQTSISKISQLSGKDSLPILNKKINENLKQTLPKQEKFLIIEESTDNLDQLKSYMLKQQVKNNANILPLISQNQYYTNQELVLMKNEKDPKNENQKKKNKRVQKQMKQITNPNDFLIDQYLLKLNQHNQQKEQQSKDVNSFFKSIENNKRKEEDEKVKKLLLSKPKIVNQISIYQTYNELEDADKEKVKKMLQGIQEIIKFIQKLNNSGQDRNYNLKIFKKLILQKKSLSQIFLNETENDFTNPLNLESIENKIIVKESQVMNNQVTIESKYNLTLLRDIQDLIMRFQQYFMEQKILTIDLIEENIIKEQKIVLNKAQKLEMQNRLEPSFFAYNCIKQLSSESIAMLQKNNITNSIQEAIKGDHSISKLFKDENIHMYNNISRNITQLHRKLLESRRNIFFFK
ncbi:hypothetical protein TTHERM_01035550 (macronuclear) [Tetrahymena thermophila SB210]|uniref:Uncharacterized protein n=1 Tax=Tetrahymena thermophila (strain SB210) TaxID=312017 RepID=Q24IA5_TETTS|nr:hypothetical protein TTHERM_01035550 [Tetrahymena thermophila SB210]EAS07492.2 hypothetical protein TTHERM_01035550 [Tetrahymena thermophila SB210]|eukprot:XP_001027734.2 hypothetical protein TTHERM_01035550 [Tetrahymena thermophila SB210]